MLTDFQAVEFPAHEYGRYNITNNEQQYEDVMGCGIVNRIEDTDHSQANCSNHGENYCEGGEDLVSGESIPAETGLMS